MNDDIHTSVVRRGISRLCHFTPSRNLVHIVTDPQGVLATAHLGADERLVLNRTDRERIDGHIDHVCCSIQYPNAWYFRRARGKERLFLDWVVLFVSPRHLWLPGAKFCPRNAAAHGGSAVREGEDAFEDLFKSSVVGAAGRTFTRSVSQPPFLTTDEQAEVLVPDRINRQDILGIAVSDETQAKNEIFRIQTLRESVPPIFIAPEFFDPRQLSQQLRSGKLPKEQPYYAGDPNG